MDGDVRKPLVSGSFSEMLEQLSNPVVSALLEAGIDSFDDLITYSKKAILGLHGIGPASIPIFEAYLEFNHLKWKS